MEEKRRHMEELEEMFERVKDSPQVVFKLKYVDAMHDRKMLFDNGWAVHMGKGLDFIRQPKWDPVDASTEYPCHDVGEASINFSYDWAEDVINYVEAIVQRDVEKFDLI
ncbi:MIT domain-containing protein 1, partial [Aphelenchoides avenae]